uniref:Uncharacterized protein n=1 Tax=Cannabis sativa TaxID=3483 RepID=A0A803QJD7_CANSA
MASSVTFVAAVHKMLQIPFSIDRFITKKSVEPTKLPSKTSGRVPRIGMVGYTLVCETGAVTTVKIPSMEVKVQGPR